MPLTTASKLAFLALLLSACAGKNEATVVVPASAPPEVTPRRLDNLFAEFEQQHDCPRTALTHTYLPAEDVHSVAGCGVRAEYWLSCPPGCDWLPLDGLRPLSEKDLNCPSGVQVKRFQDYIWEAKGCGRSQKYLFVGGREGWRPSTDEDAASAVAQPEPETQAATTG